MENEHRKNLENVESDSALNLFFVLENTENILVIEHFRIRN